MRVFLFLVALLALLAGFGILFNAKSAIHEIEAFILFLIAAVCLSGGATVEAINLMARRLENRGVQPPGGSE